MSYFSTLKKDTQREHLSTSAMRQAVRNDPKQGLLLLQPDDEKNKPILPKQ